MPSIKQIGTICFLSIISISPTFADNEPTTPTLIPATNPGCNQNVLNTTEGSAALEAIYTPNRINTTWYTGYGENGVYSSPTTCDYNGTINLPQTNPSRAGYEFAGWKLKTCSVPSANLATNGTNGYGHGWWNNADRCDLYQLNGEDGIIGDVINCSTVSDLSLNQWKAEFSYGVIKGIASCQTTLPSDIAYATTNVPDVVAGNMDISQFISEYTALAGAEKGAIMQQAFQTYANNENDGLVIFYGQLLSLPGNSNFAANSNGSYCVCKATYYAANNSSQCPLTSSFPWIPSYFDSVSSSCTGHCSASCALSVIGVSGYRSALLGISQ